jgi:hypothetical protein
MNRLRRRSVVCLVVVAGLTTAGEQPPAAKPGGEKWLMDRELTITPRAEPVPALRYRLLPPTTELKEGNSVPIYLRPANGQRDETKRYNVETPQKWNDLPLDQIPVAEARKFLENVTKSYLSQLDYGARRKTAEWNYTLEQRDPISILLPDIQQMRQYVPMLILRTRIDILDGRYEAAAAAFETGFGFSRHVGSGPFLINSLVGMSIASQFAARIPEWIERPDSPNLYWALTALPRPLIDVRPQLEFEFGSFETQFPDLANLDRPRSPSEWDAALKRFRTETKRIAVTMQLPEPGQSVVENPPGITDPDEPAAKSPDLPAARTFVEKRSGKSAAAVEKMPAAQVLLLYIAGTYADYRDDAYKLTYLPDAQVQSRIENAMKRLNESSGGEGGRWARLSLPAIGSVVRSGVRLDRRIALLRAIEALRMHAAANGGQLPETLDQVTVAPVPLDPGTDQPFEYHRDGATATLAGRIPGEPLQATGMRYRITVRGK